MAGGRGKINEYNQSLTPEQRKANAIRAGSAKKPGATRAKTIRELARIINEAPAQKAARDGLKKLGLKSKDMTNAALITAAVFRAAFEGDMKAVEKWERWIGQTDAQENASTGLLADLIDGLREPCEHDLYAEAAGLDGSLAD